MIKAKSAFTLIEVMISVLIISTVILSLLTMSGNNTHLFSSFKAKITINQYASFFVDNAKYGLENDKSTLDKLIDDFDLESDLRRSLRDTKVEVLYQELETIDMSEYEEDSDSSSDMLDNAENPDETQVNNSLLIEIGKTVLRIPSSDSSVSLLRIKVQ